MYLSSDRPMVTFSRMEKELYLASGPHIYPRVLRLCVGQLALVFRNLNLSAISVDYGQLIQRENNSTKTQNRS